MYFISWRSLIIWSSGQSYSERGTQKDFSTALTTDENYEYWIFSLFCSDAEQFVWVTSSMFFTHLHMYSAEGKILLVVLISRCFIKIKILENIQKYFITGHIATNLRGFYLQVEVVFRRVTVYLTDSLRISNYQDLFFLCWVVLFTEDFSFSSESS